MKRRRNPSTLATVGWATLAASVAGIATYHVLREVFVRQVVDHCVDEFGALVGQQGVSVTPTPRHVLEARAREFFG